MMPGRLLPAPFRSLLRSERAIAATEFGLIAPVFFVLIIGLFDVAHQTYANAMLRGAVERAARNASLETNDLEVLDAAVKQTVREVLPDAKFDIQRTSYFDFADIKRPEKFTDNLGEDPKTRKLRQYPGLNNGKCDYGETFEDFNKNKVWDDDLGSGASDSNGGAGDVVMYTVTVKYTPLFKIPFAPEMWNKREIVATSVKKNQPFAQQFPPPTATCA